MPTLIAADWRLLMSFLCPWGSPEKCCCLYNSLLCTPPAASHSLSSRPQLYLKKMKTDRFNWKIRSTLSRITLFCKDSENDLFRNTKDLPDSGYFVLHNWFRRKGISRDKMNSLWIKAKWCMFYTFKPLWFIDFTRDNGTSAVDTVP